MTSVLSISPAGAALLLLLRFQHGAADVVFRVHRLRGDGGVARPGQPCIALEHALAQGVVRVAHALGVRRVGIQACLGDAAVAA